jgi:hypothetical protein
VTDEWLEPLSTRSAAFSPQLTYNPSKACALESMELDDFHHKKSSEVFYNASLDPHLDRYPDNRNTSSFQENAEDSSCSTSSFVSASSTPYVPSANHPMLDIGTTNHKAPENTAASPVPMEGCVLDATVSPDLSLKSVTANLTLLDLRGSQRLTDKGLIQLADLSSLEVAKLDNCHSIVGRGLVAFAYSHRLRTLSLANCRRLTDEAVINISHLNSLEALSLDGCRCLTDRSLAAMSDLFRLQKLDLSQCDLLTDDGLEHLENLDTIDELSLGWCRSITDRGLDVLTSQRGRRTVLRILRLARCSITDVGVEHLARLESLEELDLNGCSNIGSAALGKTLGQLTKLTNLDVSYCPGIL